MIRFRFQEDERRHLQLVSEVYRIIATHLPAAETSTVLRDLGKIQDLLWLEGVRQGVAAAAISNLSAAGTGVGLEHLKAFQLHAHIYGSQDTPLRAIEEEWAQKLEAEANGPWLDPEPMRFAPETVPRAVPTPRTSAPEPSPRPDNPYSTFDPFDTADAVPREAEEVDDDFDIDDIERMLDGDDEAQERPELLDRIRSALVGMASDGVQPRDWSDLILRLHMTLHIDAGFLDLQLGTEMGRTVLAQAGFLDLQPGPFGLDLAEVHRGAQVPQDAQDCAACGVMLLPDDAGVCRSCGAVTDHEETA